MSATPNRQPVVAAFGEEAYQDQADFRYAIRRFLRFSEIQARDRGITPQQHLLLLTVRGHPSYPGVSIGEIAERMQVRHHSASLLVERSVKRGLLVREVDSSDRRRALVTLTDDGQGLLDHITRANRRELGSLEDSLFRRSLIDALRNQASEP